MNLKRFSLNIGQISVEWLFLFWWSIYGLVILQDYIYSLLRGTGFYWSEVTLFNSYWLLFIPFMLFANKIRSFQIGESKGRLKKFLFLLILAVLITGFHILCFSLLFKGISNLIFTPPHSFSRIINSCLSNDLYLTFLVYFLGPLIHFDFNLKKRHPKKEKEIAYQHTIPIKKGIRHLNIDVSSIQSLQVNKPYTTIHLDQKKYLLKYSLTAMEKKLDPSIFIRVHRSALINKWYIKEIASRKNGDYDVLLKNEQSIRLSRHYRKNWEQLILPST